jgi:hypothetical protein
MATVVKPSQQLFADEGGVGVGAHRIALGLDVNGQGKYQSEEYGAVLAMFVVPIGIHGEYECSFPRVK